MRKRHATLPPDQLDSDLQHWLYFVQQVCLVIVAQLSVLVLLARVFPLINLFLPTGFREMGPFSAVVSLLFALSLVLAEAEKSKARYIGARVIVGLATLFALGTLLGRAFWPAASWPYALSAHPGPAGHGHLILVSPAAFSLLGIAILLIPMTRPVVGRIADGLTAALIILALTLVSAWIYGSTQVSEPLDRQLISAPTLLCLCLLTLVVLVRRAERGVFAIFLGVGLGGKFARMVAPLLFVLPLAREVGRARMLHLQLLPVHYAMAILTSVATLIGFILLILLSQRVNTMQSEIQYLTLRDELTGLYNVRGFNLLAEQALRMSRRARLPFGILYIDLDNLKKINDKLGHDVGSEALVETANMLLEVFRESDVIGRVGGDEFIVGGHFSHETIETAVERIEAAAAIRNLEDERVYSLSFSAGYAVANGNPIQSLKSLITEADESMYQVKRRRKPAIA